MAGRFDITALGPNITLIREPGHVQSFLVNGRTTSLLIDTGMGFAHIRHSCPMPGTPWTGFIIDR